MAATGIKDCEVDLQEKFKKKDKCVRLIEMAFRMRDIAQQTEMGNQKLQLKIGIHKG